MSGELSLPPLSSLPGQPAPGKVCSTLTGTKPVSFDLESLDLNTEEVEHEGGCDVQPLLSRALVRVPHSGLQGSQGAVCRGEAGPWETGEGLITSGHCRQGPCDRGGSQLCGAHLWHQGQSCSTGLRAGRTDWHSRSEGEETLKCLHIWCRHSHPGRSCF